MDDSDTADSPLTVVADTIGERTTDAFEILGNETRLAILLALREAQAPGPSAPEPAERGLAFSAL